MAAGLVGGEAFSVDAGFIEADVNQTKGVPGDRPIDWPVREKASRAAADYPGVPDRVELPRFRGSFGLFLRASLRF